MIDRWLTVAGAHSHARTQRKAGGKVAVEEVVQPSQLTPEQRSGTAASRTEGGSLIRKL